MIDPFRLAVTKILTPAIGKRRAEEAWVTDESMVGDFLDLYDEKEQEKQLREISRLIKRPVKSSDLVSDLAKQIS